MNEAINWLVSTGDIVEIDHGATVCGFLPGYAELWAKYIGNHEGKAVHYPFTGLEKLTPEKKESFLLNYEKFCSAHYTLFNHVFSGSSRIKDAEEIQKKERSGHVHAAFLENLEHFYFHYGVVMTQFERCWAIVSVKEDPDELHLKLRRTVQENLIVTFGAKSKQIDAYDKVIEILKVRNHIEHYSRRAIEYDKESKEYWIKAPFVKGETWSQTQNRQGTHVLVINTMRDDLASLVNFLNFIYPKMIECLDNFFASDGIKSAAEAAFESFKRDEQASYVKKYGEPSLSAVIEPSHRASGQGVPLGTATAVYSKNASGDGIKT